ncbi:hypothetical protein QIS74_02547 [Colletotrichum tabaci]
MDPTFKVGRASISLRKRGPVTFNVDGVSATARHPQPRTKATLRQPGGS